MLTVYPHRNDFIDIHTHNQSGAEGVYVIENIMAHEGRKPGDIQPQPCTFGIHPWYLKAGTFEKEISYVAEAASCDNTLAIGEAGFDKLRGPDPGLQYRAFEAQVNISEDTGKPLFIHSVRAWDELFRARKKMRPRLPWLIHGFRGSLELAERLLSAGMYISFWFSYVIRPESSKLIRSLPVSRIFLETDGADTRIEAIYDKVAADLEIPVDKLKSVILDNFRTFFNA